MSAMDIADLRCDILDVLQNDDRTLLQKWTTSCREFRSRITDKIEKRLEYERDCTNKKSANAGKITELQQEIDLMKSNIDSTMLQQKIIDKKVSNVVKSVESLKTEIDEAKERRETISLEMVDLQLQLEQRKRKKLLQWDAIKRACNLYKVNLDLHINIQKEADCEYVTISFFIYNEATKNKYFVQLSHSEEHWRVENIEPKLSKEHFNEINTVTDLSGHTKILDISLFLCQVRNIFLKHYM